MLAELLNFINNYPATSIILIAAIMTLISTLVTKWLTNQEHLKQLKERQKILQKEMKNHKPGEKKWDEIQMEIFQITGKMMKSSFKPMIVTMIPFIILLGWVNRTYSPILDHWFWYYFVAAIVFSLVYRKVFDMA
jgi:uncharacterized membrane protein (DUF106 family)